MCRVLSYLGLPIPLEELLYLPDNSFIKQSYHPKYMSHLLNLAGFGMLAWDNTSYHPLTPFFYRTTNLPFYDDNLHHLAKKINAKCLLAHLRGVSYHEKNVSNENVHPFRFPDAKYALAHNGSLHNFDEMRFDFLEIIKPEIRVHIKGTTDSEYIYALFLTQLASISETDEVTHLTKALIATLKSIKAIRKKHKNTINSPVNLFITNGELIAATRFVFDYGWAPQTSKDLAHYAYHSLWYTFGENYVLHEGEYKMQNNWKKASIIIASEPLTEDTTTWIELPEYSLMIAKHDHGNIKIISQDINI